MLLSFNKETISVRTVNFWWILPRRSYRLYWWKVL